MANKANTGTRDLPLQFAQAVSAAANKAYADGTFEQECTPTTWELLQFWFNEGFCDTRSVNFHAGQRQAILNTIYLHEVLKAPSISDAYTKIAPSLLQELDILDLQRDKYQHPKYCIKLATGTGKTWVLEALLIWQYLNERYEDERSGRYTKNFLLIAPGLIVYDRLISAFMGKEQPDGTRDFATSDLMQFQDLFLPNAYREELLGFIQSSTMRKEDIGRRTGDGMIAITNWHQLNSDEEEVPPVTALEDPSYALKSAFPALPGTSQGNALDVLDRRYASGGDLQSLIDLPDLLVFNDEAHHLGEDKRKEEIIEKKWQEAISSIAQKKGAKFIQVDFSATPYNVTGSGQNRTKHHFPHIIVDFALKDAIHQGLVKTIALDKRKEIATLPLDFKAERDGREVLNLSEGQRTMLRAGVQKLRNLEEHFVAFTKERGGKVKYPKMLVICEDTKVSPHVERFLTQECGFDDGQVMRIDTSRKGDIGQEEWNKVKQQLFDIDSHDHPKVIISVLMLREGFDVNNICVIVPLRSSEAPILLEQIVGRGLRLMWREPEYTDIKDEARKKLLLQKQEPPNQLDILSIVEHPTYAEFYEKLALEEGITLGETRDGDMSRAGVLGDLTTAGLREGFAAFDFAWPRILHDQEEHLRFEELSVDELEPCEMSLEALKRIVPAEGERFYSEEITVKTRFGEYSVSGDIFTAESYNQLLAKIVKGVTDAFRPTAQTRKTKDKEFPLMQMHNARIAGLTDNYIRHRLFNGEFDPLTGNNWRILLLAQDSIIRHIMKQINRAVFALQQKTDVTKAEVDLTWFSSIATIPIRESHALDVSKTIYERIAYPTNKGGLEREFIRFVDGDAGVTSFIKIMEYAHMFARIPYLREDWLIAQYIPDFLIRIKDTIYVVETKAEGNMSHPNVQRKRLGAIDWIEQVNKLGPEQRQGCVWRYVIVGENTFKSLREKGASTEELLIYQMMTRAKIEGTLGDFLEN